MTDMRRHSTLGQHHALESMMAMGHDPNSAADARGLSPLHYAAVKGQTRCAAVLLDGGADVNARDLNGCTPLHWAAAYGKVLTVKLLLRRGANPTAQNRRGHTPLDHARLDGRKEVIALLGDPERLAAAVAAPVARPPLPQTRPRRITVVSPPPGGAGGAAVARTPSPTPRERRGSPKPAPVTPCTAVFEAALSALAAAESADASRQSEAGAAEACGSAVLPASPRAAQKAFAVLEDAAGEVPGGPLSAWTNEHSRAVPPAAAVEEAVNAHNEWLSRQAAVAASGTPDAAAVGERDAAADRLKHACEAFFAAAGGAPAYQKCAERVADAVRAVDDVLDAVGLEEPAAGQQKSAGAGGVAEFGQVGCDVLRAWVGSVEKRCASATAAREAAVREASGAVRRLADALDGMTGRENVTVRVAAAMETLNTALAAEASVQSAAARREHVRESFPDACVDSVLRAIRASLLADAARVARARDAHAELARVAALLRDSSPAQLVERARAEHEAFAAAEPPLRKELRRARYLLEELEDEPATEASALEAARGNVRKLRRELRLLRTRRDRVALDLAVRARETAPELLLSASGGGEDRVDAWREPLVRMSGSGGLAVSGLTLDSFDNLRLVKAGEGSHRVRVGELDGVRYALKEYAQEDAATMMRECARLQLLRHPCVAELCGLVRDRRHLHLQMPFYEGGTLASLAALDDARLRLLARQLLLGLEHVHRAGVVHCDIKPANLFLEDEGGTRLRIGDFDVSMDGEARSAHATVHAATTVATGGLTVAYCAPELAAGGRATSKSDVYSAGLTLFDLRFPAGSEGARLRPQGEKPPTLGQLVGAGASDELAQLLVLMLQRDPVCRPSAATLLAHAFFTSGDAAASEALREAARAEEARLGAERACTVCLEEGVREAHGAACPRGDPAHFVCDACLSRKVLSDSDRASGQNRLAEREARVYCVGYTQAGSACHRSEGPAPYDDAQLAAHAGPEAFAAYLGAREEVVRAQLAREADARVQAELERLLAMDEQARRVETSARHVRGRILTLRCPNPDGCGQAFVDFKGCFALTCGRCQGTFCAWCLEWCGADAHPHVRACGAKPAGADPYFGTREQFERSNRARRRAQLARYLATLDDETRAGVLQAVRRELADLDL